MTLEMIRNHGSDFVMPVDWSWSWLEERRWFVVFLFLTVSCFVCFVVYYSKWEIRDTDNLKLSFVLLFNEEVGALTDYIPVILGAFAKLHKRLLASSSLNVRPSIRIEPLGSP